MLIQNQIYFYYGVAAKMLNYDTVKHADGCQHQ